MPKIHALPPLTDAPEGTDVLAMDDASVADPTSPAKTKKITLTQVKEFLQSVAGWITTAMLADASVTAPKWTNLYKFQAYRSGSVALAAATKVPFNAENFDHSNSFDTTNNRFVAPIAGYYHFHASIRMAYSGADSYNQLEVMKNGAAIYQGSFSHFGPGGGSYNADATVLMYLAAGDYIEMKYQGSAGGTLQGLTSGIYTSFFEGYLVSIT